MEKEILDTIRQLTEAVKKESANSKLDEIIQLLEEQNRLLSILVGPVVSLQSKQLASMTPEERKAHSKATLAAAKAKYGKGAKRCKSNESV